MAGLLGIGLCAGQRIGDPQVLLNTQIGVFSLTLHVHSIVLHFLLYFFSLSVPLHCFAGCVCFPTLPTAFLVCSFNQRDKGHSAGCCIHLATSG